MVKAKRLNPVVAVLIAVVTVCAVVDGGAESQEVTKAFKISGSGIGTEGLPLPRQDPRPHWIVGNATHLGRHDGDGSVKTDSAVYDPDIGDLGGFVGDFGSGDPFVFRAANGASSSATTDERTRGPANRAHFSSRSLESRRTAS